MVSITDYKELERQKFGITPDGKVFINISDISSYGLTKVDEPDSTTTYVGLAASGTATSSAAWRIQKISVSGNVTTIAWADGNQSFDNVWDNRASLSYS